MKWSLRIGRLFGINFHLHFTFLFLLIFLAAITWQRTGAFGAALAGLALLPALFLFVLLHEMGHALLARFFGIRTSDVTLLPIGGIARLERMPDKPAQEVWVALAGPATNLVIALLIYLWLAFPDGGRWEPGFSLATGTFGQRLLGLNLVLAVFNLLPALPMDGGRMLRAWLSVRLGRGRATAIAAHTGQFLAVALGLVGFFFNPFLIFLGIVLYLGARAEAGLFEMQSTLHGLSVRDAMMTRFRTLHPGDTLAVAVEELLAGAQQDFPVLEDGRSVGLLRHQDLLQAMAGARPVSTVADVMRPGEDSIDESAPLLPAVEAMRAQACDSRSVSQGDRIVGLLTHDHIREVILIKAALERGSRSGRRLAAS